MRVSSFCLLAGLAISAAAPIEVASAADLSLKAPPAPRAPQWASGYVEAYTGGAWTKDEFNTPLFAPLTELKYDGGWVLGGAGRANWWALPNVSVQLDAQAEGTSYKVPQAFLAPGTSRHFSDLAYLVAGHANWRDPQRGLLGIFGGLGDAGGDNLLFTAAGATRHGVIGAEGQLYWNMLTLYGQAGYDSTMRMGNAAQISNVHQWFVRGTGRYFFTPNLMVEATGQYSNGAIEHNPFFGFTPADTGFNTLLWRLKGEWRPGMMPFSLFAVYEGSRSDFDVTPAFGLAPPFTEKVTDNRVMAGVRIYLGDDTLLANDRHGATLDIIDPLGTPTSPLMLSPFGQEALVPVVSDSRLKRDIELIGRRDDGLGIYRYRYLWGDTVYVGVMAQEVALIHPDAVVHGLDGYLRVDYSRLGTHLMSLPEWEAGGQTGLSRL